MRHLTRTALVALLALTAIGCPGPDENDDPVDAGPAKKDAGTKDAGVYCPTEMCGGVCCPVGLQCDPTYQMCVQCVPNCSGKVCGPDGCGSYCGVCPLGQECNATGQCVQSCVPSCTGKQCGPDGCGNVCGTCPSTSSCTPDGQCQACQPSCTGKQCGPDGCGGNCGSCTGGLTCNTSAGQCVASCTPSCAGKQCGDDGCGGTCGSCETGLVCNTSSGVCAATCAPNCSGRQCGEDGCGGTCGACTGSTACNTATGQCVATCTPNCTGKQCGSDGCGSTCGTCTGNTSCNESTGQCVAACTPNCVGKQCGPDGCGGNCGSCTGNTSCNNTTGQCVASCTPNCAGKQCGPDGCGGVCGSCAIGSTCNATGTCVSSGVCNPANCAQGQGCYDPLTGSTTGTTVCTCLPATSTTNDTCEGFGKLCDYDFDNPGPASCVLPGEFDECNPTVGCQTGLQCSGPFGTSPNQYYMCMQPCSTAADCDNLGTACFQFNNGVVGCYYNFCARPDTATNPTTERAKYFQPCDASATGAGDGTCLPFPFGDGAGGLIDLGLCYQAGTAPSLGTCDPLADRANTSAICPVGQDCFVVQPNASTGGYTGLCKPLCNAGTNPVPIKGCGTGELCRDLSGLAGTSYTPQARYGGCYRQCNLFGTDTCPPDSLGNAQGCWVNSTYNGTGYCRPLISSAAGAGQSCVLDPYEPRSSCGDRLACLSGNPGASYGLCYGFCDMYNSSVACRPAGTACTEIVQGQQAGICQ